MTDLMHHARIDDLCARHHIGAVVATSLPNVTYVSGIVSVGLTMLPRTTFCAAVTLPGQPDRLAGFVASRGEVDQVLDIEPRPDCVACYGRFHRAVGSVPLEEDDEALERATAQPFDDPIAALVDVLVRCGAGGQAIGIDEDGITPEDWRRLEGLWGDRVVPVAAALRVVRRVKTPAEVDRLSAAAGCLEQALDAVTLELEPGRSEAEIASRLNAEIAMRDGTPRVTLVRFGRNAVAGQVAPGSTVLEENDLVWFDVMMQRAGYWADIARNVFVGSTPPRVTALHAALAEAVDSAAAAVRPGMRGGDLHTHLVAAARASGLADYRRHHVGHGIGLELYDEPVLHDGSADLIDAGAVLSLEAPYYEYGLGALHVEYPVLVTEAGGRRLASPPLSP